MNIFSDTLMSCIDLVKHAHACSFIILIDVSCKGANTLSRSVLLML